MAGQRWAVDLGSGNYELKGYWADGTGDGQRYSYYRKSTRGHNTLTFGGWDGRPGPSGQRVDGSRMTLISQFHGSSTGGPKSAHELGIRPPGPDLGGAILQVGPRYEDAHNH